MNQEMLKMFVVAFFFGQMKATQVQFDWKYDHLSGLYEISIAATTDGSSDAYVAIAFSRNQYMNDADGYYCNDTSVNSIAIQMQHEPPFDTEKPDGVELITSSQKDGVLVCTFTRPPSVTKQISNAEEYDFDFDKEPFFVLLATGNMKDGVLQTHSYREVTEEMRTFSSLFLPSLRSHHNNIASEECGKTKVCFTHPEDCSPTMPDCIFFSWHQRGNTIVMELSGSSGDGNQYVAVAFSQNPEMKDADLYYCTGSELRSAVIRDANVAPVDLDDSAIHVIKTSRAEFFGVANCVFSRPACVTKEVSNGRSVEFNFFEHPYHILLARGNMLDGKPQVHDDRTVTEKTFQLARDSNQLYECDVKEELKGINQYDCDYTKACLFSPSGCSTTSPSCAFISLQQDGDSYKMELSGGAGDGKQYIALGFAPEMAMKHADIYYCTGNALTSAVIQERHTRPVDLHSTGLADVHAATVNGVGQCTFTRSSCIIKEVLPGVNKSFDLSLDDLYMLMAVGDVDEGGNILQHFEHILSDGAQTYGEPSEDAPECVAASTLNPSVHPEPSSSDNPGSSAPSASACWFTMASATSLAFLALAK